MKIRTVRDSVDRNLIDGILTRDPTELVDRFGGRWATPWDCSVAT